MIYKGIQYTITATAEPDIWRWRFPGRRYRQDRQNPDKAGRVGRPPRSSKNRHCTQGIGLIVTARKRRSHRLVSTMSCDLVLKFIGMNKLDRGRTSFPPTFSYRSIAGYGFFRGSHRCGYDCLAREAQMEEFVHSENLKLYRKMLKPPTNRGARRC